MRLSRTLAPLLFALMLPSLLWGETALRLRNGYVIRGTPTQIIGLNQNSFAAAARGNDPAAFPVVVVDDGLKRSFVYNRGMVAGSSDSPDLIRRIQLWQQVARSNKEMGAIGTRTTATPFNAYGRRWVSTQTPEGTVRVLQGITEINARYVQIQGLQTQIAYGWDMRVSTHAIPADKLREILHQAIDREDLDGRLDVVSFFIEAERFPDARQELLEVIRDFPEAEHLQKQLQALTQREARQILDEAIMRRDAGQYQLAMAMLQNFLRVDGIARVTRLEAQDLITALKSNTDEAARLLNQLRDQIAQLPAEQAEGLAAFVDLMWAEMTPDTFARLSDYQRLGTEATMPLESRVSLAIGGWLLGPGSGLQNLAIARSLIQVRARVQEYLASDDPVRRQAIIDELESLEGAEPDYVAKMLPLLPPPLPILAGGAEGAGNPPPFPGAPDAVPPPAVDSDDPVPPANRAPGANDDAPPGVALPSGDKEPDPALGQIAGPEEAPPAATELDSPEAPSGPDAESPDAESPDSESLEGPAAEADTMPTSDSPPPPGYFEFTVDTHLGPVKYAVQLPPEYHPLRKYPTIVALHPLGVPARGEIEWWSGPYNAEMGMRVGQASRRGYVVVAPTWTRDGQAMYEYTPIEHHRVLAALRDALRRVSIDADRVFLTGHLAGATAAWDIALAHPDLWAGLVSIGGDAGKYVMHYAANGKYVPMYHVTGEMAGAPSPLFRNGGVLDDYMAPGYDVMVTLYRGRGDELFYEDINNIFDWMSLSSHRRPAPPREIEAATMRDGDHFFWWLEITQMLDTVAINPVLFDHEQRKRAGRIDAKIMEGNSIRVTAIPARAYDILLSPEMGIDIHQPVTVRANSRNYTFEFDGSIGFMLEDARQRADRQHVFWGKLSIP